MNYMNNKYIFIIGILVFTIGGILAYSKKINSVSSLFSAVSCPSFSPNLVFTPTSTPETSIAPMPIEYDSVFSIKNNIDIGKWQACENLDCITSFMKESGASSKSIAFTEFLYKSNSNEHVYLGFLGEFKEMGKIDVGKVYLPNRANTNEVYYLLNGSPALVSPKEAFQNKEITDKLKQDPLYPKVKKEYPNMEIGDVSGSRFIKKDILPDNTERFIFTYVIDNGCHSCLTEYAASIGFDFDSNGKFLKTTFSQIVKQKD